MQNDRPIQQPEGGPTPRVNAMVLAALMLLLGLTIAVSLVDLDALLPGSGWGLPAAMAIASLKAVLVAAYFMHLRYSDRLTRVFAAAGGAWLAVLLALVLIEVATR